MVTIPRYAKAARDVLKLPQRNRVAATAIRSLPPARRPLVGLFRRSAPTTFQRCLAVHMHFAQHPSALD